MISKEQYQELLSRLNGISTTGALDGEDADRRENLHRLFMYPAMMVPSTQSAIINVFTDILPIKNAMDPFMGSGTSLLSCLEYGLSVFGQDINPFAVLLSKAKTCVLSTSELSYAKERIVNHVLQDNSVAVDVDFNGINKWFTKEAQVSFSKIRRAIQTENEQNIRLFFWVIMSETIRIGSNDRTSTFKLHCRSGEELQKRKVDVIKEFCSIANRSIEDFTLFQNKLREEHRIKDMSSLSDRIIVWGDTQQRIESEQKFDFLVSSPPYGDNHTTVTYGQTSYLPLQWIDPKDIDCPYNYVKTTQEIDRKSLGGRIDSKSLLVNKCALSEKSKHLNEFLLSLPDDSKAKYNKTISFIAGFDKCLDKIIEAMSDDAFYVWTIGNRFVGGREIPNAEILQDLMECRGFSLFFRAERHIRNKKQSRKNNFSKTMEKEIILIFHKTDLRHGESEI